MPVLELSDRFCRTAKPADGERRTDYFDTLTKGLSLRASRGGARVFYLAFTRPNGRRGRVKLGRFGDDGLTLGGARTKARELRGDVRDGSDPIAERRSESAALTVADLVESYIARHAATKKSAEHIARRLRRDVADVIGGVKLKDLHRRDITRVLDAMKDRGSPIAANRTFSGMRTMFRWAHSRGDLDVDLTAGMQRPTENEPPRDRVLDAEEIKVFWKALPDSDMRESTRRLLRLCLVTGQRVGEIAGLNRAELDLDNAIWTIPAARAKNGRVHVVPLSGLALSLIREQIDEADALAARKDREPSLWVFPGPGARAAVTGPAVAKAVKRQEVVGEDGSATILGIMPFTPHDLRRTMATHMEEIGISPFVVGHVLNHATMTRATITSRVYARYDYAKEKREALDLWADRLAGILAGAADVTPMPTEKSA